MNREQYSYYEFSIHNCANQDFCGWEYKIYAHEVIESAEYFDSENEARFAAIGHIDKLEGGPDE